MADATRHTVFSLAPPGRAALAVVAVCGPQAVQLVDMFFLPASGRSLHERPRGRIAYGHWQRADGEQVVVACRSSAEVEVHCHGGRAAVQAILDDLIAAGCRQGPWQDWVRTQCNDPIASEACIALAAARTERAAAILLDQYQGALQRAIREIVATMRAGDMAAAGQAILALLERARLGQHLTEPWRVVLAGTANVGKSSLINAIVGYQRAIVLDRAGTTRDVVTATTAMDGWPVELADTAGLREAASEPVEAAGMRQAEAILETADLRLLVFDRSQPWTPADQRFAERWPQAIVIHNKIDLVQHDEASARPHGLATSALQGTGIAQLIGAIAGQLVPIAPPAGAAVPFTPRHIAQLRAAQSAIKNDQADKAIAILTA